jgi:hypothetical protein
VHHQVWPIYFVYIVYIVGNRLRIHSTLRIYLDGPCS